MTSVEGKLSKGLVDLLINKVYVYPENRVEIDWKIADFAAIGAKEEVEHGK